MSRQPVSIRREPLTTDPLADYSRTSQPNQDLFGEGESLSGKAALNDIEEAMADQILYGTKVTPLNTTSIPLSTEGVLKMAKAFGWQHVVNYTSQLLQANATVTSEDRSILTALRYEALFRMKMYDEMNIEINVALGDIDMTIFTTSPQESTDNTKVIHTLDFYVSLQLLLHQVKLMSGHGQDALESLTQLLHWLETRIQTNPSTPPTSLQCREIYWKWHTNCHIVNNYIRCRNWKNALRLLRSLSIDLKQYSDATSDVNERNDLIAAQIVLLCRSAKLLLQIGATKSSASHYEEASKLLTMYPNLTNDTYLQNMLLLTLGLIQFSEEQFEAAQDTFTILIESERGRQPHGSIESHATTVMLSSMGSPAYGVRMALSQSKDDCPLAAAVNNYAICALYLKKIADAIKKLEQLIGENPPLYMTDAVVFNLCTLYDLSFGPETSLMKKKALQKVANRYDINDSILHWRSFRMN